MFKKNPEFLEKRHYIRLEHVFPVEFQFLSAPLEGLVLWYQAFTQDINEGGLCLTVNHLDAQAASLLEGKKNSILLHINIPLGTETVTATGRPIWIKKFEGASSLRYLVGVAYERIAQADNKRIMRYIGARKFIKALTITLAVVLSLGVVTQGYINKRLRYENEYLLRNLFLNTRAQKNFIKNRDTLLVRIQEQEFLLGQSGRKINVLEDHLSKVKDNDRKIMENLNKSLEEMRKYQDRLKKELVGLLAQKKYVEGEAQETAQAAGVLEKQIADKLYKWLVLHQNNRTGLVASFEGDEDSKDMGFTYDQALAALVFLKAGDTDKARKIFDFFLSAKKIDSGAVANGYYVSSGDVSEYIAHVGPNVWLALALCQYAKLTNDLTYKGLLEDIARWLDTMKDKEGGLRGGERLTWYSTEHNLDAYALYRMLAQITGDPAYQNNASQTLDWLNNNVYSKIYLPLVKRGKGDATIATDTYAWSIAAIGPERLKEIGMDPDGIMEFAINNCGVTADFQKPDGSFVKVKGFDFAKHQNLARGGIVSCEWTAQMIVSFGIMADYHARHNNTEKERYYRQLSGDYIFELSKMVMTSLSPVGQGEFCLPYASHEFADTGHGWRTPKGNRTGSVAGTAYYFLAIEDFNPLRLLNEAAGESAGFKKS